YYSVSGSNGACNREDTVFVTILPAPVVTIAATNDTVNPGNTTQLLAAATGTGPYSYSWYPAAGLSDPSIANPVATPSASGNYSVLVTNLSNGCSTATGINITVTATEKDLPERGITLHTYPNPFGNTFAAQITASASQEIILTLTDLAGRVISRKQVQATAGETAVEYNLAGHCSDGMYVLILQADDIVLYERVVKQE
ncbi:MAG: T9SS type A sorting domain-containing protein, partial [Sphingobacteriales bacterium]